MEEEAKAAKEQKTILEQVAQDKTEEITRLKSELERLEDLSADHQLPPTKPPVTLIGDSQLPGYTASPNDMDKPRCHKGMVSHPPRSQRQDS